MQQSDRHRLYTDLAAWWPLFSPPEHYVDEAAARYPVLRSLPDQPPATMLELGSGGGSMAWHFVRGGVCLPPPRWGDGAVHPDSDRHRFGLFPRASWLAWLHAAGFAASATLDASGRDVFTATRPRAT